MLTEDNIVTVKILLTKILDEEQKSDVVDTSIEVNNSVIDANNDYCEKRTFFDKEYNREIYHHLKELHPLLVADLLDIAIGDAKRNLKGHNSRVKDDNKQIRKRNKRRAYKGLEPLPFKEYWNFTPNLRISGYNLNKNVISIKDNGMVSLSVIGKKRIKFPIKIPSWFDKKYPERRFYSARISCNETKGVSPNGEKLREFALYISFILNEEHPVEKREITPETTIGVDRGLYNIIATSDGNLISSKPYYAIERRYAYNVKTLKLKHSSSARRRLRSIKHKRMRYNNDKTHVISKYLVSLPNVSCLVFEDLTGINADKTKGHTKNQKKANAWYHGWNFKDLEQKTEYKSEQRGITFVTVDPAFTSKTCSECGYKEQTKKECRDGAHFHCPECGHTEHADINAAKNIRDKYLARVGQFSKSTTTQNQPLSEGLVSDPSVNSLSSAPKGNVHACTVKDSDASGSENYSVSKPTSLGVGN